MDITKLTVEQLKAIAFDLIVQRDQANAALIAVTKELDKRKEDGKNDDPDDNTPRSSP